MINETLANKIKINRNSFDAGINTDLEGTEKQIAFANDIRQKQINFLKSEASKVVHEETNRIEQRIKIINSVYDTAMNTVSAEFWIENPNFLQNKFNNEAVELYFAEMIQTVTNPVQIEAIKSAQFDLTFGVELDEMGKKLYNFALNKFNS